MTRPLYRHPDGWRAATLEANRSGDVIISARSGSTPPTEDAQYWGGTFPWLTPKEVTQTSKTRHVAASERTLTIAGIKHAGGLCSEGTVLLTKRAPVGIPVINRVPMAINQGFLAFECGEALDPEFLYYWLLGNGPYLDAVANGSTYPELYAGDLFEFEIAFPDRRRQAQIVSILRTLDEKIELNRRTNTTLDLAARAVFENWVESESTRIEERSVQQLIDDHVLIIGDGYRAKNSELAPVGLPFVRAGNLTQDGLELAGAELLGTTGVARARHKVGKPGDIAFTSKGTIGRITRVSSKTREFVYSPQVCFWRSLAPDDLNANVLYRWMRTAEFSSQVDAVSGQTDMAPYVSLQDQRKMVIKLPPSAAQNQIAKYLQPIDDRIAINAQEVLTLIAIRDALLPKLLSGELRVKDGL